MKKFCCIVLLLLLLCGCVQTTVATGTIGVEFSGFVPSFSVTGDVDDVIAVNRETAADFEWTTVESEDVSLPAIMLADVIKAASPRATGYSLLLIGVDGLASMIEGDDLASCYIAYSEQYAWECVNLNHPISSKIKMLHEIVVITHEGVLDPAATGLVDEQGSRAITAGQLRLAGYNYALEFEGHSDISGHGVTVFTPHKRVPLTNQLQAENQVCVMGRNGEISYDRKFSANSLEIGKTTLGYSDKLEDIAGIMANPPMTNITEVNRDALYMINKGESVLVIELDGWGYEMFSEATRLGKQPFLSSLKVSQALAVFPPISPVGLASMLTGQTPDKHGIHDRDNKDVAVEDIFATIAKMGKTAAYVEGETSLIKTSLTPILSPDLNSQNGTDDDVYENAKIAAAKTPDFLFVHFHGIDDVATSDEPLAQSTMDKIAEVDNYVSQLVGNWNGKVIVTADHGLHKTEGGGSHGFFCREDMVVPYIITEGGKSS